MPILPRSRHAESTLPFLRDPYNYIGRTAAECHSDVFRTRLMLRTTVCMLGAEAAELFYDERRFSRRNAAPRWLQKTLFGEGGVQTLDGSAHQARKAMFNALMNEASVAALLEVTQKIWHGRLERWGAQPSVDLYREVQEILSLAVSSWGGIPIEVGGLKDKSSRLSLLFDQAAGFPLGHLYARKARRDAEEWLGGLVRQIRLGQRLVPVQSAAHIVANYRDIDGELLNERVAAVEMLNILRPTVAVSVYVVFAALALRNYPECRRRLEREPDYASLFVQEVRRFYPFFPCIMVRVRQDFEWRGYQFKKGWKAVLDLYGTNHDERAWRNPQRFDPERFRDWKESLFAFVPQGGGDAGHGHRCPAELATCALMELAVDFLVRRMRYTVPEQNLTIDYARLPALPRSFVITDVEALPVELEGTGRPAPRPASFLHPHSP